MKKRDYNFEFSERERFSNKFILIFFLLIICASLVSASRLPTVGGDDESWGSILNDYIGKLAGQNATELNETMVPGKNIYSSAINTTHIEDGTIKSEDLEDNSIGDDQMDYSEVTLADFDNDMDYLDKSGGSIDGDLLIEGNLTLIGSYFNATITNQILNGSFFPDMNNYFDLGSSLMRWATLFVTDIYASKIYSDDWSNVSIEEAQITDLKNYLTEEEDPTVWSAEFNNTGDARWLGATSNEKSTDGIYLYNDTDKIYFNETKLNDTIDNKLSGVAGDNSSWNESYADTLYADISVVDTNCSADGGCNLITYDSELDYYTDSDIDGTETAFDGWDKDASNDFDGSWNSLTDIPAGFADGIDNQSAGGADWTELTSVPAGFSDGVDNDTTYSDLSEFNNDVGYFDEESDLTTLLDNNYAPVNYGDDWNKTYADTLYASIGVTGDNSSWNESYARTIFYDEESDLTTLLDNNYAPVNYGDDWNKTYADTLYASIGVTGDNSSWNESYARTIFYDEESDLTTLLDNNYAPVNYGDDWNKTYADTLYASIGVTGDNSSWNESYADTKYMDINQDDWINDNQEADLNVNSSTWWGGVGNWVNGWFVKSGNNLDFNETKLNDTIELLDTDTTYSHLSNFTDDLGNRGYDSLSNFTNDLDFINSSGLQDYNETDLINSVNTTENIRGLGFNTTAELEGYYWRNISGNLDMANGLITNIGNAGTDFDSNGGLTLASGLTLSGSTANIALGSNFLSGDGGDEGVYVDADGKVGIGTTSPDTSLHVATNDGQNGGIAIGDSSNEDTSIKFNERGWVGYDVGKMVVQGSLDKGINFNVDNDTFGSGTAMSISTDGNVGIGTTSPDETLHINNDANSLPATSGTSQTGGIVRMEGGGSTILDIGSYAAFGRIWLQGTSDTDLSATREILINPNGGNVGIGTTTPGSYKLNIAGSGYLGASAWVYSSDRRLKENILYIDDDNDSLNKILQLNPAKFDYIVGEKNQLGFIAQDVQEVIPEAVQVTNNETGMLGLKTDFIIPYTVGAIQELKAENDELKTELEILKQELCTKDNSYTWC